MNRHTQLIGWLFPVLHASFVSSLNFWRNYKKCMEQRQPDESGQQRIAPVADLTSDARPATTQATEPQPSAKNLPDNQPVNNRQQAPKPDTRNDGGESTRPPGQNRQQNGRNDEQRQKNQRDKQQPNNQRPNEARQRDNAPADRDRSSNNNRAKQDYAMLAFRTGNPQTMPAGRRFRKDGTIDWSLAFHLATTTELAPRSF